jgi:LPXTG-site transpeptidase (sortase) family protein
MAKKKRVKLPYFGTLIVLTVGLLPLWFFGIRFVGSINSQMPESESGIELVDGDIDKRFQFCSETDSDIKKEDIGKGLVPELIKIESVNIDLPVVSVPLSQGTWKVYDKVANFAEGTSLINSQNGNVGIYGHDRSYVFSPIKNLSIGDEIQVYSGNYMAIYKVNETHVAEANDVSVYYESDQPILTLVTCDGNFSQKRFVIKADFVKIAELNCQN